jgi:hypothetical protein
MIGKTPEHYRIGEQLGSGGMDEAHAAKDPNLSRYAPVYSGLGDIERCLNWLEHAVEERHSLVGLLGVDPVFDPIRSHPRDRALLRKMNLEVT